MGMVVSIVGMVVACLRLGHDESHLNAKAAGLIAPVYGKRTLRMNAQAAGLLVLFEGAQAALSSFPLRKGLEA